MHQRRHAAHPIVVRDQIPPNCGFRTMAIAIPN
jgi:hypothetical protein